MDRFRALRSTTLPPPLPLAAACFRWLLAAATQRLSFLLPHAQVAAAASSTARSAQAGR